MKHLWKLVSAVVLAGGLLIPSAACTINPTITSSTQHNQCGGTIVVSGNGFTPGGQVNIQVLGFWERSGFVDLGNVSAPNGSFTNFEWGFSYQPFVVEPGCAWDASQNAHTVTVMAKDLTTGTVTFSTATTAECPIEPGACPA